MQPQVGLHVNLDGAILANFVDDALDPTVVRDGLEQQPRAADHGLVLRFRRPLRRRGLEGDEPVEFLPAHPLQARLTLEADQRIALGIHLLHCALVQGAEFAGLGAVGRKLLPHEDYLADAQFRVPAVLPLGIRGVGVYLRGDLGDVGEAMAIGGDRRAARGSELLQVAAGNLRLALGLRAALRRLRADKDDAAAALRRRSRRVRGPLPVVVGVALGAPAAEDLEVAEV
mmetsp:Transcript_15261/g.44110  ORF Transcript_15261/g.44110 Transcript_15261/m.44110 type:complete len:229 (+) Transcript_15261:695-1381(+)